MMYVKGACVYIYIYIYAHVHYSWSCLDVVEVLEAGQLDGRADLHDRHLPHSKGRSGNVFVSNSWCFFHTLNVYECQSCDVFECPSHANRKGKGRVACCNVLLLSLESCNTNSTSWFCQMLFLCTYTYIDTYTHIYIKVRLKPCIIYIYTYTSTPIYIYI